MGTRSQGLSLSLAGFDGRIYSQSMFHESLCTCIDQKWPSLLVVTWAISSLSDLRGVKPAYLGSGELFSPSYSTKSIHRVSLDLTLASNISCSSWQTGYGHSSIALCEDGYVYEW